MEVSAHDRCLQIHAYFFLQHFAELFSPSFAGLSCTHKFNAQNYSKLFWRNFERMETDLVHGVGGWCGSDKEQNVGYGKGAGIKGRGKGWTEKGGRVNMVGGWVE